jgi:hypothetical protein
MHEQDKHNQNAKRIAVVMRSLLARYRFDTLADVVDATKLECLQLKVPWTTEAITDALRLAANRLPPPRVARPNLYRPGKCIPTRDLPKRDAAARWQHLRARCGGTIRTMS